MRVFSSLTLFVCFMLSGCLSTVRIKSAPASGAARTEDVPGIPFYVKTAKCKQETTWTEPVYTLTLKRTTTYKFLDEDAAKKAGAKLPGPQVRVGTKVLSRSQFQPTEPTLQTFLALLNKPNTNAADTVEIESAWAKIIGYPDYVPLSTAEDSLISNGLNVIEISNTASPEAIVDYSKVYYYNAPRPWVGSSQVDAKLAADGTLTEGSAQVQGQTLSTILTAVTSVLSTVVPNIPKFGPPGPPPDATSTTDQYDLTIQKDAYQHIHTRYAAFATPCTPATAGVTDNYALTISVPNQASAAKDDSNTVKVNGTVSLPKTSAATPGSAAAPK
jgi:hypothetical protein